MPQNQIPPSTRMIDGKVIVNANVDNAEARIAKLENAPAPPPGGGAVSSVDGRAGAVTLDDLYPPVLASIAALRAITTTTATVVAVLAYNAGSGEGGGLFRLDSSDTTTVDDNGLVVVDAGGRRWKRILPKNNLTPDMFGAQYGTDATTQVQAMINKVRTSYNVASGGFRYVADLAGKMWQVSSIDMTLVRQPGMTVHNGGLFGTTVGRIVLDMSGSNAVLLDNILIASGKTAPPAIGLFLSRTKDVNGVINIAPNHKLNNVQINGYFSKAAFVNFASEVCGMVNPYFRNQHRSQSACAAIITGSAATLDSYVGGVVSDYATIPTAADGLQSCILHDLGKLQALRPTDAVLAATSITKANPAVVTVGVQALADSGIVNGDVVFFDNVVGMTELNGRVFVVANLNAAAGTFQLSGLDSTTFGIFTSGKVLLSTGPAMRISSASGITCESSYFLTYGNNSVRFDLANGSCSQIRMEFQGEALPPAPIRFDLPATGTALMRDIKLSLLSANQTYYAAIMQPVQPTGGTGAMRIDNLDLRIASMSNNPINGIFQSRNFVTLRNARINMPLSATLTPAMATAVGSGFASISGEVYAADTDTLDTYGTRVAH